MAFASHSTAKTQKSPSEQSCPRQSEIKRWQADTAKVLDAAKSAFSHAELDPGNAAASGEKTFPDGQPEIRAAQPARDYRLSPSAPSNSGLSRSFLENDGGIADQRLRPKTDAEDKTKCDIEKS